MEIVRYFTVGRATERLPRRKNITLPAVWITQSQLSSSLLLEVFRVALTLVVEVPSPHVVSEVC